MCFFFRRESKYRSSVKLPQHVQLSGFSDRLIQSFLLRDAQTGGREGKMYTVREKTEFFMSRSYVRGLQIGKNCVHSCGHCRDKKIKPAT